MQWPVLFQDLFALIHLAGLGALLGMWLRPTFRDWFERRCVGTATARDLAYVRIVACAVLLLYMATEDLPAYARLGPHFMVPPGLAVHLGGVFDWFLSSAGRLWGLTAIIATLGLLGMVGCATRFVLPLLSALYFVYAALLRGCGKPFHEGYLVWYVLIVLSFLPCADAWSVDARWRRGKPTEPAPPAAYGWHVWACYAATAVPYVQLAFSKLISGGIFWFDGRSLRNYVLADNLTITATGASLGLGMARAPTFLWTAAALVGLLIELFYPLVLVAPRLRRGLAASVVLLHIGIWLGQNALFLDTILIPAIYFSPSTWRRRRA